MELKEQSTDADSLAAGSRVQLSVDQINQLAMVCIRLEALSSSRVFKPIPPSKHISPTQPDGTQQQDVDEDLDRFLYADPAVLMPQIGQSASDADLMVVLDSLSLRIDNALSTLKLKRLEDLLASLDLSGCNGHALSHLFSSLNALSP